MKGLIASLLLMLALVQLLAKPGLTITCGDVNACLSPCVTYLTGAQPEPAPACCDGIKKLKSIAATTTDQRFACNCVKTAAAHFQNLKDGAVATLPAKCSSPLPFPINLKYDCTKIP